MDNLLASFLEHIWRKVLLSNAEDDLMRTNLQNADERLTSVIALLQTKRAACEGCKTDENKEELKRVQGEKNNAVTERTCANRACEKKIRSHSRKYGSFTGRLLEATCQFPGMSLECHHGGKFNDVNCIRTMDQSSRGSAP